MHNHASQAAFVPRGTRASSSIVAAGLIVSIAAVLSRSSLVQAQGIGPASVLTQHNDNSRTGANLRETVLNTSNVDVNQFGKLFSRAVDGQVYAQPLYVPGVSIGQSVHNVVYVATMNNSVYAFDADDPAASTPLWQVNLGPPVPVADVGELEDINQVVGITSTPVIDSATRTLYCVAKTKEGDAYVQRLHALDITSGHETLGGPVVIEGSVPGTGHDNVAGVISFNPLRQLNRPGLLLSNGYIYIAFGSHGDQQPYHGWVLGYDAATLQHVASFNVTPGGAGGGIWSSGQGLAVDDSGGLYFMTGNGTFDMNAGGQSCGSCFVKLSTPSLNLLDWFAPYNQNTLNADDFDLNSSGQLVLPGTDHIIGGGKEGVVYVVDGGNMGRFQAGSNGQIVQSVQVTFGDHLHGSPVYWESPVHGPLVYMWHEESHLKAFKIVNGAFQGDTDPDTGLLAPATQSSMAVPQGMPGGVLSLSANGTAAGSGIVWATAPYDADARPATVTGIFRAFDASDLSVELWNSRQNAARDDLGNFAKFTPPTIANGKVYLATFSNQLLVYGLLGTPAPAPTVGSVSPSSGPTSGGTTVTITGTNFGAGATVSVGGSAATGVSVVNSTRITATTPAHAAGTVNVTVTNADAHSGTLPGGFTYAASAPAPTVGGVSPSTGSNSGGTAVTITGTNFGAGATVSVGGGAATGVSVVNSTTITATTPPHAAGTVSVTVTNADGQSGTLSGGFAYAGPPPATSIAFVQVAAATPQSPTATVPVAYPSSQTPRDLNIVVVGWNDTTATVQSVRDSGGNTYSLAIGPTTGAGLRQSVYYAPNIVGGSNTVTVTFSQAAVYPDVRIQEYSGVSTLDVTAGASGSGTTSNSGTATTTEADELIFGANMVSSDTRAAGTGFTSRIITHIDSDLAEDMIVATAGTYNATAALGTSGNWVMQMATFKNASAPAPAPTIVSVAPASGPTSGGTALTIKGSNFGVGAAVTVGGTAATGVTVVNNTTITATTPAHAAGPVNVSVTNADAQSGTLTGGFTYTSASAGISLVQHTSIDAGTTTSSALAFAADNTAHGWIAVVVRAGRTGQTFTITDTRGNTYRKAVQLDETVDGTTVAIVYAENIAGGTNTVTVSDTIAGGTLRFAMFEYSGVATANSFDAAASAQGTSSTPSSGAATTTTTGDLVIGGISTGESATFSAGSGYVVRELVPAASAKLMVEDRSQPGPGAVSASATLSATAIWGAIVATFKPGP